jgi:hypothetical protein
MEAVVANSAHIYQAKSGNWNISFHHPICREGSIGKKIHRSLKVSNETQAIALQKQADDLLALAETPSLLPTRSQALAGGKYGRVVVDAFFDCMTPEPVDYAALREEAMPFPPKIGRAGPVPRILVVGATAAGKSRLIQHLLQTTRENYPMRGAGRTTVADTETIIADEDYSAVLTIFAKSEIREILKENILEACAFAHKEPDNRQKIATKLMVDSDKRFRLNFVLGEWVQDTEEAPEEDEDYESGDDQAIDSDMEIAAAALRWSKLESCVGQVATIAKQAFETARAMLQPASDQDESVIESVIEEYWLQNVDEDQLNALSEEILEELEARLCTATGELSWPVVHRISETPDKDEFFRRLRPFYQNDRKLFGSLVTPLVQGVRVRGRFAPPQWASGNLPNWVLLDGQGVGHEQGGPTKINRTIPPDLAIKFSSADIICLVDRAVPAMTGDAPILLENLIVRGHQDRLALVFTHFEAVAAPDLNMAGRKAKVLEGLSNAVQSIASLPKAQRVILESTAEIKAYFLASMDANEIKLNSTRQELKRLCDRFKRGDEARLPKISPVFNEYEIANVLRKEIEAYRRDWSEVGLSSYHWKIMEALTNWIGHAFADGYPKRNLYPGQDLSQRLVSAVSSALETPRTWEPYPPESADESRILNAIRSKVGDKIDTFCRDTLVRDPRISDWLPAYENIFGYGTKVRRARSVARILEDRAQLPDEGLGQFTKAIWQIVQGTIAEVCSLDDGAEPLAKAS